MSVFTFNNILLVLSLSYPNVWNEILKSNYFVVFYLIYIFCELCRTALLVRDFVF